MPVESLERRHRLIFNERTKKLRETYETFTERHKKKCACVCVRIKLFVIQLFINFFRLVREYGYKKLLVKKQLSQSYIKLDSRRKSNMKMFATVEHNLSQS